MVYRIAPIIFGLFLFLILLWTVISHPIKTPLRAPWSSENLVINPLSLPWFNGSKKTFETKYGLDIVGGVRLVYQTDTSSVKAVDKEQAVQAARNIIEKRVNYFGVAEPVVQTIKNEGGYRITVDLPGYQDAAGAAALIGQTAQLNFIEHDASLGGAAATNEAALNKVTDLTGKDVKKAQVVFDQRTGEPSVQLLFNTEGAQKFAAITKRNIGKQVGILLDQSLVSAPIVQTEITGGEALITGNFTVDNAKQLATAINSGALPIPIQLVQQTTIGPSLGQREVNASVYAGLIGVLLVALFMVIIYRGFGVIAIAALAVYALLSFALFRFIPVTLTLSGLAGFILSLGMAVDANVLIFERIKEELRKGKTMASAIPTGFGRAMDAIKDANFTTLIVCFILFNPLNWSFLPQFGMVKGFAVTLAIGVLMSLFTGVVVTRRIVKFFYKA